MESFEEVSSILEHTASDGYLPRCNPIKSRIKQYSSFERRPVQSDTAMRNKNSSPTKQAIVRRSHPAKHGEDRFGPPTLERNGSEHRRAVTSLLPEEEGLGEKVELPLAKGRRRDSKKSYVRI